MVLSHYISIYVDLALWVPFWKRFMKMKRFMGGIVDEHGTQQIVEILGPPTIEAWETCFTCFITACIIFNVMDKIWLTRYARMIKGFANTYPKCGGLIYQADVRMRDEKVHRTLADLEE